jgi:hypothetical protein
LQRGNEARERPAAAKAVDDSGNPAKLSPERQGGGPPASTSTRRRITPLRRRPPFGETYFVFEVLPALPLELPEPMLPLLEPAPLEPLGEVVELGEEVELLLPPLAAPEPDLLKCASHSERDTCPSLFLSTEEKSGLDELLLEPPLLEPPDAALPEDLEVSDEPDELLPDAAGEDEDELPDAAGEDGDEELCATATLDSANSAAAVAALRTLSFMKEPPGKR